MSQSNLGKINLGKFNLDGGGEITAYSATPTFPFEFDFSAAPTKIDHISITFPVEFGYSTSTKTIENLGTITFPFELDYSTVLKALITVAPTFPFGIGLFYIFTPQFEESTAVVTKVQTTLALSQPVAYISDVVRNQATISGDLLWRHSSFPKDKS